MKLTAAVLLILLDAVSICAIYVNDSCNSGGTCLHTWTKPVFDEKRGAVVCECQNAHGGEGSYSVTCFGSDLSDGPRVIVQVGHCLTFDEESNFTFMGQCPYNHLNYKNHTTTHLPQSVYELNNFMCNNHHGQNFVCGQQKRKGLLCSKCQSGLGPAVASYTHQCVECYWYGPLLYLAYTFSSLQLFFA